MSDIVERLRSTYLTASFNALNGCQDCGIAANDASQAADEITRLTEENRLLKIENAPLHGWIKQQDEFIERLSASARRKT